MCPVLQGLTNISIGLPPFVANSRKTTPWGFCADSRMQVDTQTERQYDRVIGALRFFTSSPTHALPRFGDRHHRIVQQAHHVSILQCTVLINIIITFAATTKYRQWTFSVRAPARHRFVAIPTSTASGNYLRVRCSIIVPA